MRTISSRKSDRVRELVRLHKKSERYAAGLFLAEGPAVVRVALESAPANVNEVFVTEEHLDDFSDRGATVTLCSTEVIEALSGSVSPQGVIALCHLQTVAVGDFSDRPGDLIVLDNIADPGNLGTILRTADATAAAGCLIFGNCVDPYNDKVVRSSAGSIFRVPISQLPAVSDLPAGRNIFALSADSQLSISDIEYTSSDVIWIVGSEAHGVSSDWQKIGAQVTPVRIPMAEGVDSLNAAVAASVCMYTAYLKRVSLGR